MNRRHFLKCTASAAVAAGLSGWRCSQEKVQNPNIIFILADDMGYGDPQCLNPESQIPTPNMNRLAEEGMIFTDAHSGSAVCTPTRYGVLTGRYSWRTHLKSGVLWGYSPMLIDPQRMTVASLLKKCDYRTACVGKWHLGLGDDEETDYSGPLHPGPVDVGFDYFFGIPASLDMIPYVYVENDHVVEPPTETVEEKREGGVFWRGGPIAPNFEFEDVLPTLTEKAVGFIDDCANESPDQPFFLYFPISAPHTPWVPTEEFRGKSGAGLYGDFVHQVDHTIGQVLEALDRHNLADNTLVILSSDNGADERFIEAEDHDANHIYRGQKSDAWDGGHRIPFIARWPEHVKAGSECSKTICLNDLLLTCAAIIDEPVPEVAGEDSYNILPYLLDETDRSIREATVHHSVNGTFAIRKGQWKLIFTCGSGGWTKPEADCEPRDPKWQLYDMKNDVREQHNLYNERQDIVQELDALLKRYKERGRSAPYASL